MQTAAISPANARFWVRPYEFEGDGSSGAAADVASLKFGGKRRTFWLKTLENRLFFREVGRDEDYNFGALDTLNDAAQADLPRALADVLACESYGRVVLLHGEARPCFGLAAPNKRMICLVPNCSLRVVTRWKPTVFAGAEPTPQSQKQLLLDWEAKDIRINPPSQLFHEFRDSLAQIPMPIIELEWVRGSRQDHENILKSFIVHFWSRLINHAPFDNTPRCISWNHTSAWQMGEPKFYLSCYYELRPNTGYLLSLEGKAELQCLLNLIVEQYYFIGQGERKRDLKCTHYLGTDKITQPTQHEILEAHLFLRDWINQRLPPEQARKWLDFS